MSRKDSASKRLARIIKDAKQAKRLKAEAGDPDFDRLIDFDDPDNRAKIAHHALQIDPDERWTQPLWKAFKAFDFDPRNPFHWRNLLIYFADAHFGRPRWGRKPQSWTGKRLCQLLIDFAQQKRATPDKNDSEICRSLKRDKDGKFQTRYSRMSPETVRRKLQDARNPALNGPLRQALDIAMAEWLPRLQAKVEPGRWTQGHQKMIRDALFQIIVHPERLRSAEAGGPVRKADRATVSGFACCRLDGS